MSLDRFELVELRYDDGIQTYYARDAATSRPVQVHLFAEGQTRDTLMFLSRLAYLPDEERRRVIDRGVHDGIPYLVTERLAGYASLREWIDRKSAPTLDQQFAALFEEEPQPQLYPQETEPQEPEPDEQAPVSMPGPRRRRIGSIVAMVLGMGAALIFLVLLIAFIAFRPHQL